MPPSLLWAHFVNDALNSYLPGVLPYIALQRHLSLALASALMLALLFGQMLQPLAGAWADRIGGRALILGGPLLGAAATFGLSFGRTYPVLAASLLLTGVGNTLFHPQALAVARRAAGRAQGAGMSAFLVAGEFGRALAPIGAGMLVARWGATRLWPLALPLALTWPWIWRAIPSQDRPSPSPDTATAPAPGAAAPRRVVWRRHLGPAAALVGYAGLRAAAIYGLTTFVPLLWSARGGSLVAGASLVTTLVGIGVAGNLAGGAAIDRWGRLPVLVLSSLLPVAAILALVAARGFWLWPLLAATGICLFSALPVTMLLGQDVFPENPALGSGVALGLGNGLGALLVLPLGLLSARFGIDAAFWAGAACLLLSLAFVASLSRVARQAPAPARPPLPVR